MLKCLSKLLSFVAVSVIIFMPICSPWLGTKPSAHFHRPVLVKRTKDTAFEFESFSIDYSWHFIKNRQLSSPPAKYKAKLIPITLMALSYYQACCSLPADDCQWIPRIYNLSYPLTHRVYLSYRKLLI